MSVDQIRDKRAIEEELEKLSNSIKHKARLIIFLDTPRRWLRRLIKRICEKQFR